MFQRFLTFLACSLVCVGLAACGSNTPQTASKAPAPAPAANPAPATGSTQEDICNCTFVQPVESDYRTAAKHVLLPSMAPIDVSMPEILKWTWGANPSFNASRSGRELQMFRVPRAYLQLAWINEQDCDLHLEISETPDRNAPRVIVETPREGEYCSARKGLRDQLAAVGELLTKGSGELKTPRPVEVIGLAFQDYDHPRGSSKVATTWEIHPATVKLVP